MQLRSIYHKVTKSCSQYYDITFKILKQKILRQEDEKKN
jgi:hypothetical protein